MAAPQDAPLSPGHLSLLAADLFRGAGAVDRAKARYRPFICPFHEVFPLVPAGSRVLDIGCGNGLLLGLLASTGRLREGAGYDLSGPAIGQARAMAERIGGAPLSFFVGDSAACVPGGDFDAVTMVDVIHHVPRGAQESFWRAAAARVRPGGLMVYKDMVDFPSWRAWTNTLHDVVLSRQVPRYVRPARVEAWARDAGFVLRESRRFDMLWYGHELRVFERRTGP